MTADLPHIDHAGPSRYGLTREVVDQIIRVSRKYGDPVRVILYGSRSRGDFDERSDIDLAVDGTIDPLLTRGCLEEEVRTLRKFDVVHVDDLNPEMLKSISREGVILYDKAHESAREL